MPARHLIAGLQFPLDRDINLHHFDDARRQFIARLELFHLFIEIGFDHLYLVVKIGHHAAYRLLCLLIIH
ncbi:MAG: hypothetical protein A4E72_01846 [Syntrophus sp. PtaU1.Bin208]|nr:MAG: hypothetical protein A4E72_01846 [Syntrophus sp. PtaU1.Bin208]